MKRTHAGILLIVGVIFAAGAVIVLSNGDAKVSQQPITSASESDTETFANTRSAPAPLAKGEYVSYSPAAVENTKNTKLLFFHAGWCRQCQEIDESIKSQGVPDGVSVIKVDYDTNHELRKKYGVTLQTTFVRINDQGEIIRKFVAYQEPTFDSVRRELL